MRRWFLLLAFPLAVCAAADGDQEDVCREYCKLKLGHLARVLPPLTDDCNGGTKKNKQFKALTHKGMPYCQCVVQVPMPHRKEKASK